MRIEVITCRTALSDSKIMGFDYSLNPYFDCSHSCAYCYAPNILRVDRDSWGSYVRVKINIPKVLSKELKHKERGVVGISSVTDPYQALEREYKLTRYCLEQLLKHDFPISIMTKSSLVKRDFDLIARFSESEIGITITTLNVSLKKILEPNSSSIQARIETLRESVSAGIDTYAFLGPLYPTTEVDELQDLVEKIAGTGVKRVMADKLNLKKGVWDSVRNALRIDARAQEIFRQRLFGDRDYYKKAFSILSELCKDYGVEFEC